MKGQKLLTRFMMSVIFLILIAGKSQAFIVINEILADPPSGAEGDANKDGLTSSTQDEMIEIFNRSLNMVDISGWSIHDALKPRHIFESDVFLEPQGMLVVFGGGTPNLVDVDWVVASSGSLGLNNTDETVFLYDANNVLIDSLSYGSEGGKDQSLVRSPEGYGNSFIQHLDLENANGTRYSAGYFVNDISVSTGSGTADGTPNPTVPEIATIWYLTLGGGLSFILQRKRKALA